ncbi:hypothetical protein GOBAR_AA03650 [Gossypium barbadense]|uniref:Uncharacterized protein n=1 Tax=Gossypium barbadense TaxID=3634 RepID=A0A2P5YMV0_GOSBA|nr:hypothetical protein GOBAR_AA03650 [Gossypium barbadense]
MGVPCLRLCALVGALPVVRPPWSGRGRGHSLPPLVENDINWILSISSSLPLRAFGTPFFLSRRPFFGLSSPASIEPAQRREYGLEIIIELDLTRTRVCSPRFSQPRRLLLNLYRGLTPGQVLVVPLTTPFFFWGFWSCPEPCGPRSLDLGGSRARLAALPTLNTPPPPQQARPQRLRAPQRRKTKRRLVLTSVPPSRSSTLFENKRGSAYSWYIRTIIVPVVIG